MSSNGHLTQQRCVGKKPVSMWNMCLPAQRMRHLIHKSVWQGGKGRCVGLVTTVRLKWCILLFFIWSLPRRSYFWLRCFLSGAGQSLKHPEGQCVLILCQLVIPGDAVGTQTRQDLQSTHLGKTKSGSKNYLRTVSCLPLWAGWNLECVNAAVSGTWGNSKTAYLCWKHFQQRHRNML